ncbi:MAG: M48 family metallopeptidase [Candidatus Altimarinota bacterium]
MNIYQQIAANNRQTIFILVLFTLAVLGIVNVVLLIMEAPPENFPIISVVVFAFLFLWTIISYYTGDKLILNFVGAKPIERKTHFEIYNLVENLAITAGLPNPKVYIIEDESLNAFATGRNPEHSVVCLTTGIINKLDKRELEAVISHELAHIANYDIRLELLLITVIGALSMAGEVMIRARGKKAGGIVMAGFFVYLIGAPLLQLIRLAMSRNREYLADATGAFYTRDPEPLASALEKISVDSRIESADRMKSTAHLFIADPRHGADHGKKNLAGPSFFTSLLSTHPPISERVQRLRGKA